MRAGFTQEGNSGEEKVFKVSALVVFEMSRVCVICKHPLREKIEALIIEGLSYRDISRQFELSKDGVLRHKPHLSKRLKMAKEAEEIAQADNLVAQVKNLQERALKILSEAEKAESWKVALVAIRECRSNLELLAKLLGEIKEPKINIMMSLEGLNSLSDTQLKALAQENID